MIAELRELVATVRKERASRERGGADDCYTDNARSMLREGAAIEKILAMIEAPACRDESTVLQDLRAVVVRQLQDDCHRMAGDTFDDHHHMIDERIGGSIAAREEIVAELDRRLASLSVRAAALAKAAAGELTP